MDEIRIVLFTVMFVVVGWHDFKTRSINDKYFAIFGGIGAMLYAFDWESTSPYQVIVIVGTIGGALALWRFKIVGTADVFAIMAGGIIYPVHLYIVPTMLAVYVVTIFLAAGMTIIGNAWLNYSDIIKRGGVFRDVSDGRIRKCWAFLSIHRQRKFDKHVFLAEKTVGGKRRLDMGAKLLGSKLAPLSETAYVEFAMPFLTVAAGLAVFLLFAWMLDPRYH